MSMEIVGQSRSGKPVRITHDIRIEIFRTDVSERFAEPLCPEPEVTNIPLSTLPHLGLTEWQSFSQVQVLLPPISKMRTVVDRLQVHSDLMLFQADTSGTLQLSATNDDVSVLVEWHKLQNPPVGTSSHLHLGTSASRSHRKLVFSSSTFESGSRWTFTGAIRARS